MDKEFIAKSVVALAPITIGAVIFCLLNLSFYGYPIASFDVVLTHYEANPITYSPLLPAINSAARWLFGGYLYNFWWILLSIVILFVVPYILLFEITKKHRYGVVFIYGTAIPIIGLIGGALPQAIVLCLILLLVARPSWFWPIMVMAATTHAFGVFAIAGTWLWLWYDARYPTSTFLLQLHDSRRSNV